MKKFVCSVCGYVYEGAAAPEKCPQCGAPASKFVEQAGEKTWAAEHVVGVAKGAPEEILQGLRENFQGECSEVGMYLAMARVAHREGYPEIGLYWEKAAYEEAEHAAKFAELLGELVTDSTKKNLEMRVEAENGATMGKFELAKLAKQYNLDAIHDTVHEMARDEARHGKAFEGLLKRYFGGGTYLCSTSVITSPRWGRSCWRRTRPGSPERGSRTRNIMHAAWTQNTQKKKRQSLTMRSAGWISISPERNLTSCRRSIRPALRSRGRYGTSSGRFLTGRP